MSSFVQGICKIVTRYVLAWYEAEGRKGPRSPSLDNHISKHRSLCSDEGMPWFYCDDVAVTVELIVNCQIDKQPRKRLQKGRRGGGESEHGKAGGGSEATRTKSQKGSQFRLKLRIPKITYQRFLFTCSTSIATKARHSDIHNNVRKGAYVHSYFYVSITLW